MSLEKAKHHSDVCSKEKINNNNPNYNIFTALASEERGNVIARV
jgi:hypothetical protein